MSKDETRMIKKKTTKVKKN